MKYNGRRDQCPISEAHVANQDIRSDYSVCVERTLLRAVLLTSEDTQEHIIASLRNTSEVGIQARRAVQQDHLQACEPLSVSRPVSHQFGARELISMLSRSSSRLYF
jgi:hypothetical protein